MTQKVFHSVQQTRAPVHTKEVRKTKEKCHPVNGTMVSVEPLEMAQCTVANTYTEETAQVRDLLDS